MVSRRVNEYVIRAPPPSLSTSNGSQLPPQLPVHHSGPSTQYSRSSSSSSRHNYDIYRDADVEHLIETSPPRSYHDTDNMILDGSGARSRVSRARSHLKDAEQSAEAVQKRSDLLKFNNEQCKYLCDKLCVVIQSARSVLKVSEREKVGTASREDDTDLVKIFELLMVSGKQIESFVEGCCEENWIQAAMVLTNVSEYVSSLGFNLHLCEVAFGNDHAAASGCLTLDEVDGMKRSEAEAVEAKASVDAKVLIEEVVLTQNSLKGEDRDLSSYLLQRLLKIKRIPSSGSGPTIWSILFDRVKLGQQVGRGASATVYTARWLGTCVAIKTFNGPENVEFVKESQILSQFCHPNITSMFYCTKNKRVCSIIMELMDGDLNQLMLKRCEDGSDSRPFPILEAVDIMLQTGEGVNYLHNQGIVHRDLKSRNILYKSVNGKNAAVGYVHVKVADFGISKARDTSTTFSDLTLNTGTHRWMPPEVIGMSDRNQGDMPKYPFKLDSYSFGLLCYEILVGREPFWEYSNPNEIKRRVLNKERPILPCKPSECPLMLKALIEKCWSHEPDERPKFGVICRELTHIKYSLMTGGSMKHGVDSKITKVPEYSAVERAIKHLLRQLRSGQGDMQRTAAGELRLLARRNVFSRACIAEAGAIPLITELLSSQDLKTQEHAVTALLNLSINDSNKEIIVNCGAIVPIVEVLKNGGEEARENAAATLFSLSLVDENKGTIGSLGAIPALVDLLKGGTSRGKKDAATALFHLSIYQGNKARAVEAGVVPPLMGLLRDPSAGVVDESLAILANLSTELDGRVAIGQAAAVPELVDLLKSMSVGSPRIKENAAAVLFALARPTVSTGHWFGRGLTGTV